VIGVVGISCGTAVIVHFLDTVKTYYKARAKKGTVDPAVQETLRAVREEMAELRRSSSDVVLTFDATLQRLDTRLQHLEQQALGSGRPGATLSTTRAAAAEEQVAINAR
jgi:hypothetical protein